MEWNNISIYYSKSCLYSVACGIRTTIASIHDVHIYVNGTDTRAVARSTGSDVTYQGETVIWLEEGDVIEFREKAAGLTTFSTSLQDFAFIVIGSLC
jgi:hypothetical protein